MPTNTAQQSLVAELDLVISGDQADSVLVLEGGTTDCTFTFGITVPGVTVCPFPTNTSITFLTN